MSTLGGRLRNAREEKGWSQLYVAQKTGISNTNISNYERDYREPDMETLQKLADLYEANIGYLVTGHRVLLKNNNDDPMQVWLRTEMEELEKIPDNEREQFLDEIKEYFNYRKQRLLEKIKEK